MPSRQLSKAPRKKSAPGKAVTKKTVKKSKGSNKAKNREISKFVPSAQDSQITQLGQITGLAASPDEAVLEAVPNPQAGTDYLVRFVCPEVTSLCPVTGQPDFAHLVIDFVPNKKLVESKSLKLFLGSFRNHGGFHEDCTVMVAKRIIEAIKPKWLRIGGYWYPRGGIPIDVFYQTGEPPKGVWLPDQGVPPYRGRG